MSPSSKSATNSGKDKKGRADLRERAFFEKSLLPQNFFRKNVTQGAEKSSLRIEGQNDKERGDNVRWMISALWSCTVRDASLR